MRLHLLLLLALTSAAAPSLPDSREARAQDSSEDTGDQDPLNRPKDEQAAIEMVGDLSEDLDERSEDDLREFYEAWPPLVRPEAKVFYEVVTEVGWKVDRIVSGHGRVVEWQELIDAIQASETSN